MGLNIICRFLVSCMCPRVSDTFSKLHARYVDGRLNRPFCAEWFISPHFSNKSCLSSLDPGNHIPELRSGISTHADKTRNKALNRPIQFVVLRLISNHIHDSVLAWCVLGWEKERCFWVTYIRLATQWLTRFNIRRWIVYFRVWLWQHTVL